LEDKTLVRKTALLFTYEWLHKFQKLGSEDSKTQEIDYSYVMRGYLLGVALTLSTGICGVIEA